MVKGNDLSAGVTVDEYRKLETVVNDICEAMRLLAGSVPFEQVRHAIYAAVHANDIRLNEQKGLDVEGKPIE